jgi:hypothetical protein
MTEDYAWHVRSYLAGAGRDPRRFVHYVQRYRRPDEPGRAPGFVSVRCWNTEAEAEAAAAQANAAEASAEEPSFSFQSSFF